MKCIRVLADVNQIKRCKNHLQEIDDQARSTSNALSLTANQVRLKIIFLLHKEGSMCPCDLSDILNMTVPAISQHLRKMKAGRLVADKKIGQTVFYSLLSHHDYVIKPILENLIVEREIISVK